ncbi:MAG: LptF/LptG family permease [candidate division Zixibacteria bacterium]|nr:LptF/LptG family permease [candidate division Zixibacteria bacterium]
MTILSRYILKEHIAPFLFAFFTITFLLIIDYVPKIIDHVIDKDLSFAVVFELIALNLAWMLALSVPMSVLVATLMAFGRLTSDFEITAMKASGVNLLRVLVPVLIAGGVISGLMIEFNDRVLPDLNKKARLLWGDISVMRPTLVFKSGVFISDIPGYLVLIDRIDHSTSRVEGVRITETKDKFKPRIVVAEYGYLKMTDGGRNMQFTLYNGEVHSLDTKEPDNYRKVDFQEQIINIAGTSSELVRTDSDYRTDREMPISQMKQQVTQAENAIAPFQEKISTQLSTSFAGLFSDSFVGDSGEAVSDSVALAAVRQQASALNQQVERTARQIEAQERVKNKYMIEIYKKYSIPTASLAFILIGAPLGVMSKRGGMAMAIGISIVMFVIYWAFLIGGEDLADRGIVSPFWAMWGANILLGTVGLYLLYVVVTEKPVFSFFRTIGG